MKLELYHFHKEGVKDNMWKVNKTIYVPTNFNSSTYKRYEDFSNTVYPATGYPLNYYELLEKYAQTGIPDAKTLMTLLSMAHDISFASNEFKRETAMENYRLNYNKNLPSRLHSIYLTDEDGIDAWMKKFGNSKLTLYRVEAEGNIFKTNEQLIPDERDPYKSFYDEAYNYWNPNFKVVPKDSNEYLVQGKVKILETIKTI